MSVFRDSFEQCPRCGIELVDAGSARSCSRCQGLWLREDVLTEMVTAMLPVPTIGRLVFAPTAQDQRVACPSCHAPMVLTTLAEIVVDRSAKHGVWFDREELEQVLRRSAKPSPMIGAVFMEVDTSRVLPPGSPRGIIWPGVPVLRFQIVRKSSIRLVDVQREIRGECFHRRHPRLVDVRLPLRFHRFEQPARPENPFLWFLRWGQTYHQPLKLLI